MKDLLVFNEDVVDLACGDDDASLGQLVLQQRLRDVVVMILVQDITDEHWTEVLAGQHVGGQRRQQALTVGRDDAFAEIAGDLGPDHQFLNDEFFIALGHRAAGVHARRGDQRA